jgi:hypothetical protein
MLTVITCLCVSCLERDGEAFRTAQSLLCLECEARYAVCLDCDHLFALAEAMSLIHCDHCLRTQADSKRVAA